METQLAEKAPMKNGVMLGQRPLESLLSLEGINWHESHWGVNQKPIPVILKSSQAYSQAGEEISSLESRAIQRDELAGMLFRLQGHYWTADVPERVLQAVAEDYMRLMLPEGYSLLAMQRAYDKWLKSGNKFFPKIGELEEYIKTESQQIKWRLLRLKKLQEKAQ